MGFRYPIPNEKQAEILRANGIDPNCFFVKYADAAEDGTICLQCYKTGDEVRITQNVLKRRA